MPQTLRPLGVLERAVMNLPAHRTVGARPGSPELATGYFFSIAFFVLALAVRWSLDDDLPPGYPFLTFFPAVIVVAFVFGVYPGTMAAVLSVAACWFAFIPGTAASKILPTAFFASILAIDIAVIHVMHKSLARVAQLHERAETMAEERELVVRELAHRINNLIANVSSLLSMAARGSPDVPSLIDRVRSRLGALGAVSSIFHRGHGVKSSPLADIVSMATAPVASNNQISLDDQIRAVEVRSSDATSLSLIFHELATNAVKYGALANHAGRISVSGLRTADHFTITWQEQSGTTAPAAGEEKAGSGFGSILISRVASALGGTADYGPTPEGYRTVISISADRVADLGTSAAEELEETTRRDRESGPSKT